MPRPRSASSRVLAERTTVIDGRVVHVVRKPIKNLYLRVHPEDMSLVVSAPPTMGITAIEAFAHGHRQWIEQQERKLKARDEMETPQWTPELRTRAERSINAALPALLAHWEPVIGRAPSHITLRTMTSRWGSCTPRTGRIRLNLQLGVMDARLLEYVLVHEMTHLWAAGHGVEFQRHMDRYLPHWRELRTQLNHQRVWR